MLMFVSVILLFEVINYKEKEKTTPYLGMGLFIITLISIVLLMVYKIPHGSWWQTVIIYIGFFMLCYECFSWQSPSSKFFSFTPLRWLGNMSYSYYLIHGLAVKFIIILIAEFYFTTQVNCLLDFLVLGTIVYMFTLIPAFFLFFLVDKPFSLMNKKIVNI